MIIDPTSPTLGAPQQPSLRARVEQLDTILRGLDPLGLYAKGLGREVREQLQAVTQLQLGIARITAAPAPAAAATPAMTITRLRDVLAQIEGIGMLVAQQEIDPTLAAAAMAELAHEALR